MEYKTAWATSCPPYACLLCRHFERSEKSIDISFASLRMTAVVVGSFTVILSRQAKKSHRNRDFSQQVKKFLTGGISFIYNLYALFIKRIF